MRYIIMSTFKGEEVEKKATFYHETRMKSVYTLHILPRQKERKSKH